MSWPAEPELWVGREEEVQALAEALRARRSCLVYGPAGAGKTALAARALRRFPAVTRDSIYLSGVCRGQDLLRQVMTHLGETGNAVVARKRGDKEAASRSVEGWVRRQTSLRLKGILLAAAKEQPCWILLDHFPPLSHALARLLKDIQWRADTPVYLLARGHKEQDVGAAWSLYWHDRLRLRLGPLGEVAARELLERCIRRFGLVSCEWQDFAEKVLERSGALPGAIVEMCRLAALPRYHYGRQIKAELVHTDYLLRHRRGEFFGAEVAPHYE